MISNKKILITGGAGFIGSNLFVYFFTQQLSKLYKNLSPTSSVYFEDARPDENPFGRACVGLPVRARRGGSCVELDGLVFFLTHQLA